MIAVPDSAAALKGIEHEYALGSTMMPEDPERLWDWCRGCSRDDLLRVLALIAAHAVSIVQSKADRPDGGRFTHGSQLADALALDMRMWFVPGAENYFGRINRTGILAAIDEAEGSHAPALEKLKKAELAAHAQDLVASTGWLPKSLRTESKAA
jgi:ParB family chromosome partitioning protein